ncbi:MAG: DPP IV N-terminal domain-containing protein [Alistipes sp.]|nr:DPP IV N-terminal domain-containing protein [Alistipes sp.]
MKRLRIILIAAALCSTMGAMAGQPSAVEPNYDLAERFSPGKLYRMVPQTRVAPQWFRSSSKFWYWWRTPDGTRYYVVDPAKGTRTELWDMASLAAGITEITGDPFDAEHLPVANMELQQDRYMLFDIATSVEEPAKNEDGTPKDDGSKQKKTFHFSWDMQTRQLSEIDERDKRYPDWVNLSPDGSKAVYERNYNLWYMSGEDVEKLRRNPKDTTVVEHRLTDDGTADFSYSWYEDSVVQIDTAKRYAVDLCWSPDSRRFAVVRNDVSRIKDLWVIDVLSEPRPKLQSYKYQMPGEESPAAHLELFDMEDLSRREIAVDAYKDQTLYICERMPLHSYSYDKPVRRIWLGDNDRFYFLRQSRDIKRIDLCAVDVAAAECRQIVHEQMNTSIESREPVLVNGGADLVQWSERTGWAHLYLYSADGQLRHAITSGDWHVSDIVRVDDVRKVIYFVATGYDKSENPYYNHLFRVNYDGSGLRRLDPADHNGVFSVSDDGRYFTTTYSRVDTAPVSELYTTDGRRVMQLEEVDMTPLMEIGYRFPERFTVKAADGVTDLYGVMYKPFDFDPSKKYPIIEYVYPGPQTEAVNESWSIGMNRIDRLAQIGFIVITVGNRGGHPDRSKWYHNYGYGNLRDYGLKDKVVAAQQLAARHSFIDINRVGIHGHSGGGFMSTAAILMYPDFFKAAVSCAGNHDNRIYNRWWSEKHHGIKEEVSESGDTTFVYKISTNPELASRLKGHLLLVHGDMDDNVHPGNTIRVVDALIKANKRFDMLILPGQHHGFGSMNEYFFWKMADYFAEHLLGSSQQDVDIRQLNNDL